MVVAQTAKPSFGKEIAPILHEKCAQCHRPGEVAPMSLMSYEEVRPWVRAIKTKVVSRQMPPWYAEGEHGKWRNDRRLSQADIDKIVAWVDAGAPRGSDAMPDPPQLAHGWNHPSGRPPDLIIETPEFKVAAEGEVPWWYANVKLPFQGDVWVEAAQVVPGNRAVVHHVLVTSATLPSDAPATELVAGAPTSELLARGAGAAPRQPRGEAAGGANAVGGFRGVFRRVGTRSRCSTYLGGWRRPASLRHASPLQPALPAERPRDHRQDPPRPVAAKGSHQLQECRPRYRLGSGNVHHQRRRADGTIYRASDAGHSAAEARRPCRTSLRATDSYRLTALEQYVMEPVG